MKTCKKCKKEYEGSKCKPCAAEYMRKWNANNPEKVKSTRNKKYIRNKDYIDQKNKEWTEKNRDKSNAIKKAYKERNREIYLAQQREYAKYRYIENREELLKKEKSPDRKKVRKVWIEENRDRLNKEYLQKYHNSEDVKLKYSARGKVRRAIQSGKLIKAEKCSNCGCIEKLQAHHSDYLKPLDVIWLCISCHKRLHSKYFKQDAEISA